MSALGQEIESATFIDFLDMVDFSGVSGFFDFLACFHDLHDKFVIL